MAENDGRRSDDFALSSWRTATVFVACCGQKLSEPAKATDLYVSSLFKKSKALAERAQCWYILSANYGLIAPTTVIAPYDLTLKQMTAAQRMAWGVRVREQCRVAGLLRLTIVALAGLDYVSPLRNAGMVVQQPMCGLIIGLQLQWLDRQDSLMKFAENLLGDAR